jgi:hypothetical protein
MSIMTFLPVRSAEAYKRFACLIKKQLDLKLSQVQENLAKSFGHGDFHAVMKFAAQRGSARLSNISQSITDEQVELWVKKLEEIFGKEVQTVFDRRSPSEWLMSICTLSQASTMQANIAVLSEVNSENLFAPTDVIKPLPTVTYKKRRRIEFPR